MNDAPPCVKFMLCVPNWAFVENAVLVVVQLFWCAASMQLLSKRSAKSGSGNALTLKDIKTSSMNGTITLPKKCKLPCRFITLIFSLQMQQ